MARYSIELAAVILCLALRAWNAKKRIPEAIRQQVSAGVTNSFLDVAFGAQYQQNKEEYTSFINRKYGLFAEICPGMTDPDEKKRRPELIGLARYLAAQASSRPEEENAKAIEALGVIFLSAVPVFLRLAENSAPDIGVGIGGKPKFMVQK